MLFKLLLTFVLFAFALVPAKTDDIDKAGNMLMEGLPHKSLNQIIGLEEFNPRSSEGFERTINKCPMMPIFNGETWLLTPICSSRL